MSKPARHLQPVQDRTLRAQIAEQLNAMVTNGVFSPGERLTEQALARELGVSRAPLREAIRALVDQGLLVSQPYKGLFVRPISATDLHELFTMRIALEQFAFRLCWDRRTPAAHADLGARYDALTAAQAGDDQAATIRLEIRFHSWVYELGEHSLLIAHWERLKPLLQIYMSLHHEMHGSHGQFRHMTREYLALARGDDLDAMLRHIDAHMRQGLDSVMRVLPRD